MALASVKQEEGSHFEGWTLSGVYPFLRVNSYPDMRLEMGDGMTPPDAAIKRSAPGTFALEGRYFQVPVRVGASPDSDCDKPEEVGRLVGRTDGPAHLLFCTKRGWKRVV